MSHYWVRVENDKVVECLDYNPNKAGDWRQAVEVKANLIPNRQVIEGHVFDITKNPVELIWEIRELSIEERKDNLLQQVTMVEKEQINTEVTKELECCCESKNHCCVDALTDAIKTMQDKRKQIATLTTHEEIDSYMAGLGLL